MEKRFSTFHIGDDFEVIETVVDQSVMQRFNQTELLGDADAKIAKALANIREDIDALARQSRTTVAGHGERLRIGDFLPKICEGVEERIYHIFRPIDDYQLRLGRGMKWLKKFVIARHTDLGYAPVCDAFLRLFRHPPGNDNNCLPRKLRYAYLIMELADLCKSDERATR